MRIRITIAAGVALMAIALGLTLRHSPLTVTATNDVHPTARFALIRHATTTCSTGLALPRGTAAIRLAFAATTGPRIALTVTARARVLTRGTIAAGWYGSAVTIPVRPLPTAHTDVTICASVGPLVGDVAMLGEPLGVVGAGSNGQLPGRVSVAYLRRARQSWWSRAGAVIEHLALGRAASGRWIVIPIVGLTAAAIALASLALTRELS